MSVYSRVKKVAGSMISQRSLETSTNAGTPPQYAKPSWWK
jgi:hypothetical protein